MAETTNPQERVHIRHPKVAKTAVVSRRALETVWGAKGWTEIKAEDADLPRGQISTADQEIAEAESGSKSRSRSSSSSSASS